jgi:hypothetical protein
MSPLRNAAAVAALAVTVCFGARAGAQPPAKPAADNEARVHRMEIWNGPVRSVSYFTQGYSPGEESALRDLGRAENELAIADDVQGLRRLYLRNERILEQRRGQVNPLLYGYSSEYAAGLFPGYVAGSFGYGGFAGFPSGYPYGVGGFGNIAGTFGYPGAGASLGSVANSLAFGVGSEGVIKDVLAQTLAPSAGPEAVTRAARAYDAAVARVADSDRLRTALGWDKGPIAAVGHERTVGGAITLTLKDGSTVEGTLAGEDGDWFTVDRAADEVSVRKADVTRIARPKAKKEGKP